MSEDAQNGIGTLNENPLHAGLKEWYARPGDALEVPVDGYVVDIVRDDLLIEIQTSGLYPIRDKLRALSRGHPVRLVFPLAKDKWLLKRRGKGKGKVKKRRSPKHCSEMDVFGELVTMPCLLAHPNFSLELALVEMEEVRHREPGRAWRRNGWVIEERRLVSVVNSRLFESPLQMADLLPEDMEEPFTTADLSEKADISRNLAQKACYCLRKMGAIEHIGKRGNAYLYRLPTAA